MSRTHLGEYSESDFRKRLVREIQKATFPPNIGPSPAPTAVLLGGQSGAGKTTLHRAYRKQLEGNVIVINGDEVRSSLISRNSSTLSATNPSTTRLPGPGA